MVQKLWIKTLLDKPYINKLNLVRFLFEIK